MMNSDDSNMAANAICHAAYQAGEAWKQTAYAWMPNGEMPTLRDIYAAAALCGLIASSPEAAAEGNIDQDDLAQASLRMADAMLKARRP